VAILVPGLWSKVTRCRADNSFTGRRSLVAPLPAHPNVEAIRHDVTFPLYVAVDEISNLACPAAPVHHQHDPVQTAKTSVHGMIQMPGLAKRTGARILQASTSAVHAITTGGWCRTSSCRRCAARRSSASSFAPKVSSGPIRPDQRHRPGDGAGPASPVIGALATIKLISLRVPRGMRWETVPFRHAPGVAPCAACPSGRGRGLRPGRRAVDPVRRERQGLAGRGAVR
jgi:hypothetical protein